MSSTAFPKVALRRPPKVWPSLVDSSSVAKLSRAASGIIAKKFSKNTAVGLHPTFPAIIPSGTKTRRMFTGFMVSVFHVISTVRAGHLTHHALSSFVYGSMG